MGKQSQLLLKPTDVELGLQVGVEFDKNSVWLQYNTKALKQLLFLNHYHLNLFDSSEANESRVFIYFRLQIGQSLVLFLAINSPNKIL